MYSSESFKKKVNMLHIELSDKQYNQYVTYYKMVVEKNKVMNLTGITEFDEFIDKHYIDSLSIVNAVDIHQVQSAIDVGTGAGFPGIPLKIAFPHLKITLLDSLNKRINFLNEVVETLGLENVETCHGRAEDFGHRKEYREQYDLCTSRAVANLSTLSEYCVPFVKIGGQFVSYKSGNVDNELRESEFLEEKSGRSVVLYFLRQILRGHWFQLKKSNQQGKNIREKLAHLRKSHYNRGQNMIRGVYLNTMNDDLSKCMKIYQDVFEEDMNENVETWKNSNSEDMAIYLLLYNENEIPVGTARLIFDFDGVFKFDGLAVLPEFRKNGYGDFIMHMIFDKAYQSGAHYLVSNDIYHMPDYFKKYGFSIENNHLSLDLKQYFNTHKCCH